MAAYHQMGHHSENLLTDPILNMYGGAILSPVNYNQAEIGAQVTALRNLNAFRTVFDPQLYVPTSSRGKLRDWKYFPSDVDTADLSSPNWWDTLVNSVAQTALEFRPSAVFSPAVLYRTYSAAYFVEAVRAGSVLKAGLDGTGIDAVQTVIVATADLTSKAHQMEIGSIVSGGDVSEVFLVLVSNVDPRRELNDAEELKGVLSFIALLEAAAIRVTIGYCSSDILLWKAAGATNCATGKFFNLRRFTRTRFDEPVGGGGQLEYWFEQSLMAFLRQSDLQRVSRVNVLSDVSRQSPCYDSVVQQIGTGKAWLALGWRQYMHWFGQTESAIQERVLDVDAVLAQAEDNWEVLKAKKVLMEEVANDGRWLRPWRRALAEYQ